MNQLPKALQDVIDALGKLPGVGPRTAERYAYYLLRNDPGKSQAIADHLRNLHSGITYCPVTFALIDADQTVSPLYSDPERDKTTVAVVAEPFDIIMLEKTSLFKGTYHVLGGLISPIDGIHPEHLHIDALIRRINKDGVKEIILATNASVEGESTAMYLQQQLEGSGAKITRLARGMPVGVDLAYTDLLTLGRALEGRQAL